MASSHAELSCPLLGPLLPELARSEVIIFSDQQAQKFSKRGFVSKSIASFFIYIFLRFKYVSKWNHGIDGKEFEKFPSKVPK